jgi:hypothetical protein
MSHELGKLEWSEHRLCRCADRNATTAAKYYCADCDDYVCEYCADWCERRGHELLTLRKKGES